MTRLPFVDDRRPPVWLRRPELATFPGLGPAMLDIARWNA